VGLLVGSEKDQGMPALVFGDSDQIISQVVGLDFGVLFVFDHDFMPAPVQSNVLQFPNLQVETSAFAQSLNRLHLHLAHFGRRLVALRQALQILNKPQVVEHFLLPIERLNSNFKKWVNLIFPLLELVQVFAVLVKLCVDDVLAVVEPNVKRFGT
jgi:hypothetical protein